MRIGQSTGTGGAGPSPGRLEWRIGDGGDPAALLEDFLADAGLAVRDLSGPPAAGPWAQLHISAAAGAVMAGGPPGRPSPAPEIPDLVAVVHPAGRHPAGPHPAGPHPAGPHPAGPAPAPAAGPLWIGGWEPSWTPAEHAAAIGAVLEAIGRGDVYQVNVVGHAAAAYRGDPGPALDRVLALPGATWAGRLSGPGWALACASPECLVTVVPGERGAVVTTRPIKGTAPRTAAGRRALRASAKERAEHVMIVDLARNDLGRIAEVGSVTVDELFVPRPWCDLWQAESTVTARLAAGAGLAAVLRAVCPGGSVTGAPKRAALGLLGDLEPVGRGPAMGALGTIGPDGLKLGLTIRTVAAVAGPRPGAGRLHLWAGGGITWSSVVDAEVAEAAAKAGPLRAALPPPQF